MDPERRGWKILGARQVFQGIVLSEQRTIFVFCFFNIEDFLIWLHSSITFG